eukprot:COSAG02_NODE_69943_length_197_cov_999.102041_1_plen_49_part_01
MPPPVTWLLLRPCSLDGTGQWGGYPTYVVLVLTAHIIQDALHEIRCFFM